MESHKDCEPLHITTSKTILGSKMITILMEFTPPIKIFVAHPSEDKDSEKVLKILDKRQSYRYKENYDGWAFRITKNVLLDYYRKTKTKFSATDDN